MKFDHAQLLPELDAVYALTSRDRVIVKRMTTNLPRKRQYAVMRAKQDEEYQEVHEAIEYMNGRHGKLLAMLERKQKLTSGAREDLRGKIFQEIRVLDEIDLAGKEGMR